MTNDEAFQNFLQNRHKFSTISPQQLAHDKFKRRDMLSPITVLDILRQQDVGITLDRLIEKAKVEEIKDPLEQLKCLIDQGKARMDANPYPPRAKATNLAFS